MENPFKLTLLLLALLLPATVIAENFWSNKIQYTITSDTTVKVIGHSFWSIEDSYMPLWSLENEDCYLPLFDIDIPDHVIHNNLCYTVTEIGDSAFYSSDISNWDYYFITKISEYLSYTITIPETVITIGANAFGGYFDLINVIFLGRSIPIMNNSFSYDGDEYSKGNINLFVLAEAYPFFEEENNSNHYFSSIHITNGERTDKPNSNVDYFYYPPIYSAESGGIYACSGTISSGENTILYARHIVGRHGPHTSETFLDVDNWNTVTNHSLSFFYEDEDGSTIQSTSDLWEIEAYTLEEGKSPSRSITCGGDFHRKPEMSFDFEDSELWYNIVNQNEVEVTYCCFYDYDFSIPTYYYGNVVIPNTAIDKRTYRYYTVTSIGQNAFGDSEDLDGVTLPETITSVQDEAFYNCPSLTFIKCMGSIPPVASNYSFDDGVCRNAVLYVPFGSEDAYRNADGWSNFLSIVGFSDIEFDLDGISYKVIGENSVIVISGEEAYSGNVLIPETVTVDGVTYAVMGIGSGAFANDSLNFLTIPVNVTSNIASDAFEGCFVPSVYIIGDGAWADGALPASVDTLYISSDVTGVEGLQVNPSVIFSYAALPPTCDGNSFTGYDAELHVPASSLAAYFTEPYWSNFINIVSDAVEPTGLSLENDSISIMVGNQITLMATVTPDNATPQQVFWASTNDSIAKIRPINGELTALKAGECDIKATLLDKTVVCHVTVTEIAPAEVTISQEFAKLEIGSQLTLTATVLPEDATDKVITWTTTNSDVATVDSLGNVMAMGQGECFITATCRDKQAMCHVIVVEHFIYITLDEHRLSLLPNHMEWLTPTVTPVSTDLVVTSSNPSVAAARMANGKIQVVGITEGTTIIKVNSVDGYAEADSCRVTVRTQRGDVNYDGFINITDVTMMISQLMSAQSESYYDINADVNNDGEVNISDVTRLISHLMTGAELEPKDENPIIYETFTVNGVSFKMIKVEGGTFMMGATEEEDADYQVFKGSPKHQVTLSDYSIGETEVTQELWLAVMGSNPSANTGDLLRPVENVNWFDCDTFIMRLNALTGKEFRLPSEAEWEFAAHGGNLTQGYIYAGSDSIDEVAWYIANSDNVTHAVATKAPNELGIYDMNGNAEEWCNDWYYLYTEEPVTNPTGPETGRSRVHRGGRYSGAVKFCRITRRDGFSPGVRRTYMGLRLAM